MIIKIENYDFLYNIYAQDFGDDYHRTGNEPSTELERNVRKIRRRYRNLHDYLPAAADYKEYMTLLAQKHGGTQLFKLKLKNGLIEEFIPHLPRMKNTPMNRYLMKNKIVLSEMKVKTIKCEELLKFMNENSMHIEEYKTKEKLDKNAERILEKEGIQNRIKNIKNIHSLDHLEEYFKSKNNKSDKEYQDSLDACSLKDLMKANYEDKIYDTSEEDDVIFYRGRYLNRDSVNEIKTFETFSSYGWNSLKIMKSKCSSKSLTRIMKEKSKESKKKNKKRKSTDDFLTQLTTDNNYSTFSDFEEDMLSFTSRDIFK